MSDSSSAERIAVVTGTTHGIGSPTAAAIANAGYRVVMACRDLDRGQALAAALRRESGNPNVEVLPLDLASLASVRDFAARLSAQCTHLDLLVNNAGMMSTTRKSSRDGFELTFATNHLGPFLLTLLLLPLLHAAPRARIVNVASNAHLSAHLEFDDLQFERRPYKPMAVYGASKLCNVMTTLALQRRLAALRANNITVNCLHPGVVGTNIFPNHNPLFRAVGAIAKRLLLSVDDGAKTSIHVALSDAVAAKSGLYFDEHQHIKEPSAEARDRVVQERLWSVSEALTGETYTATQPLDQI